MPADGQDREQLLESGEASSETTGELDDLLVYSYVEKKTGEEGGLRVTSRFFGINYRATSVSNKQTRFGEIVVACSHWESTPRRRNIVRRALSQMPTMEKDPFFQ